MGSYWVKVITTWEAVQGIDLIEPLRHAPSEQWIAILPLRTIGTARQNFSLRRRTASLDPQTLLAKTKRRNGDAGHIVK